MVGVIEGFRSILLGNIPFPIGMVLLSGMVSTLFFIFGMFYFRQMERFFSDII
jgi:lipopolysaccharide transport system permease protein